MNLKSACLLLSLCHAGNAAALGLGELNVRSHLGQPLHVTVKIVGATPATDTDCFSLVPSEGIAVSPLPRARLRLERSDNQTLLHIRTAYAINDPIAQFALASDCESRLRRDYVVLLDPPSRALPVPSQNEPVVSVPAAAPANTEPMPVADRPAQPRIAKRSAAARPAASSSRAPTAPSRKQTASAEAAPRLVLSGRHGLDSTALSLRLDTNLPDLNRPPPEKLTPDQLSDENTALTRKLAHLEAQLVALQKRNAEIEAKRAGGTVNTAPRPTHQSTRWPLALLVIGLLIAAGGLVVWLRRRSTATNHGGKDAWLSASSPSSDIDRMTADPWTLPPPGQAESTSRPESVIEYVSSTTANTTEVKDDILDQAEVYMAHGHGDLAIHLLQEHLREAPDESPVPWLLLLDLLHREGDSESYATASAECRRYFNINLSGHPVSQDNEAGRGLEAYPHLLEQLVVVWGSPVVENFFHDLIFDKRGGTRIGFEPSAYRDILLLRAISQDVQPPSA